MGEFLRSGHHEAILPVEVDGVSFSLRAWIEMSDLVPLLERLDALFGETGRPYCTKLEQLPVAQETLVALIAELLRKHPEKLRRACVEVAIAQRLRAKYGIGQLGGVPAYPPSIDQVDLDPAELAPVLPALLRRGERG